MKRSSNLRFFGGCWAFPGGVADKVDQELAGGDPRGDSALLACGMRELFEEVGVLVGGLAGFDPPGELREGMAVRGGPPAAVVDAWRGLCEGASNLLQGLRPIGRITTPGFRPLRYETLFLHAELPKGATAKVLPGELDTGQFEYPKDVLDQWKRGEREVVPPVLFLLELLVEAESFDAFFPSAARALAAVEAGRLHASYATPGIMAAPLKTPTLPPAASTNCYLVGEERVFVVDPGTYEEGECERLFETLDRWQAAGREISGVLLTHQHGDHVGAVAVVCARYDVPLFAHLKTLEALDQRFGEADTSVLEAGVLARPLGARPRRVVPIEDGERFDLGCSPDGRTGWELVARHTPGHARGHMVFVDERHRAMVVGDMVSTVSTILIDPPEGHLATYLVSLNLLLQFGGESEWTLLPAHGPWTSKGAALVRRYLAHREEREASLVRGLERGLRTADELVAFVYSDTDERLWPLAKCSLAAGLVKLREEGRLVE